jgi:peroxiredoxin
MPWIRFDQHGQPAPSTKSSPPLGSRIEIADFRGRANLVIFFPHGVECEDCGRVITELAKQRSDFQALDTETIVVLPSDPSRLEAKLKGLHPLSDPEGVLRRRYAALIEFDTNMAAMLFVLDKHGVPYAGWVGEEATDAAIPGEALKWLEFISIQCPE